jgi:hypothetical protein
MFAMRYTGIQIVKRLGKRRLNAGQWARNGPGPQADRPLECRDLRGAWDIPGSHRHFLSSLIILTGVRDRFFMRR